MKQNILAVVIALACLTHVSSRVIGARSTKSVLKQRVHAPRHFIPHSENAQKQRATNEASGKAFFFAAFKKQNPLEAAKLMPSTSAAPTPAPTAAPTKVPTQAPTPKPCPKPKCTKAPQGCKYRPSKLMGANGCPYYPCGRIFCVATTTTTRAPTQVPTRAPTRAPTAAPTKFPTKAPTTTPTEVPTMAPTKSPTKSPTKALTKVPTLAPSPSPTPRTVMSKYERHIFLEKKFKAFSKTSKAPTPSPTPPTASPTSSPTSSPTPIPTPRPTRAPSRAPTNRPTAIPTPSPTATPTPYLAPCPKGFGRKPLQMFGEVVMSACLPRSTRTQQNALSSKQTTASPTLSPTHSPTPSPTPHWAKIKARTPRPPPPTAAPWHSCPIKCRSVRSKITGSWVTHVRLIHLTHHGVGAHTPRYKHPDCGRRHNAKAHCSVGPHIQHKCGHSKLLGKCVCFCKLVQPIAQPTPSPTPSPIHPQAVPPAGLFMAGTSAAMSLQTVPSSGTGQSEKASESAPSNSLF